MGLSVTQNFDSVTAPALPSGYTFDSPLITSTSQKVSTPNGLTMSGGSAATDYFAAYNTPDTVSNTWVVSCAVWMNANNAYGGVMFNGSSTTFSTNSMYFVRLRYHTISNLNRVNFSKRVSGTPTSLFNVVLNNGFTASRWYNLSVSGTYSGSTTSISVTVQDTGTGKYLNSSGDFVVGSTSCMITTDASAIAPGYLGLSTQTGSGGTDIFLDDLSILTAPSAAKPVPWHFFSMSN